MSDSNVVPFKPKEGDTSTLTLPTNQSDSASPTSGSPEKTRINTENPNKGSLADNPEIDDNEDMTNYSKDTIDAKFETLEQKMLTLETKLDGKLDLIVEKIGGINTRIEDLWKVTIGFGVALFVALLVLFIQNSFQKPEQTIIQIPEAKPVVQEQSIKGGK